MFAPCCARMFGESARLRARAAAAAARRAVCDSRAAFIEQRGGAVHVNAAARVAASAMGRRSRHVRRRRPRGRRLRTAWFALPDLFETPACSTRRVIDRRGDRRQRRRSSPSTCGSIGRSRATIRRSAGRAMQWVFDKRALFGEASRTCRSSRAAPTAIVARTNEELIDLALGELRRRCRRRDAACCCVASSFARSARRSRSRRVQPRRPRTPDRRARACSSPATGSIPACPLRSKAPSSAVTRRRGGWREPRIRPDVTVTLRHEL